MLIVILLAFGVAGYMMLSVHERGWTGFLLGFFLAPIGLVIAWVMRSNLAEAARRTEKSAERRGDAARDERRCPFCAEWILAQARVCKHCGRDVEPISDPPSTGACPVCNTKNLPLDARSCPSCGAAFNAISGQKVVPD